MYITEEEKNMKDHGFYVDLKDINILIITGVCRSGKTLIARLIATMEDIIYFDEPWLPMMMPVIEGFNLVDCKVAKNIIQAYTKELLNDAILQCHLTKTNPKGQDSKYKEKLHPLCVRSTQE